MHNNVKMPQPPIKLTASLLFFVCRAQAEITSVAVVLEKLWMFSALVEPALKSQGIIDSKLRLQAH